MKFAVNGNFLYGPTLGVQRYAKEITLAIDKRLKERGYDVEIIMPTVDLDKTSVIAADYQALYEHIKIVVIPGNAGRKWDQIHFNQYVRKQKAKAVYLCNEVSLFMRDGIVAVHDIAFKTHPEFFTEPGDWHEILFRRMMYRKAFKKADAVMTVSEFSKNEILAHYGLKNSDIIVAGNGWQHYDTTVIDEAIFERYASRIKRGKYYFYLASLAPNKNLKWILENARANPDKTYVIAGKMLGDKSGIGKLSNVVMVGYIKDAESKALMKHCRAFLFPSTYEGFGIPPMEALCMGAKVILGDIPVLREIYDGAAAFVDCGNAHINLDEIIDNWRICGDDIKKVLGDHSWEKSAEKLLHVMDMIAG